MRRWHEIKKSLPTTNSPAASLTSTEDYPFSCLDSPLPSSPEVGRAYQGNPRDSSWTSE